MATQIINGKEQSVKTSEENLAEIQELLKQLTPEERATMEFVLKDLQKPKTDKTLLDTLKDAEYIRPMVDIETFVKDPYYLGLTCSDIWPVLLEDLKELEKNNYEEAIFTGSTRSGKSFIASILVCWFLYKLSCMRDPQRSLGIAAGSKIACIVLSANEALAREVAFSNIAEKIAPSPYFQKYFEFKDNKGELVFPNNIVVVAKATTDRSAIGFNLALFWMDELDFINNKNKHLDPKLGYQDSAEVIYSSLKTRMKNTFKKSKFKGIGILSSSLKTVDNFMSRHLAKIKNKSEVFVRQRNAWTVLPHLYETSEKFHILVGNELMASRILEEGEYETLKSKDLPDGVHLVEIPEEFRSDFENNIEASIQDLLGNPTTSVSPFLQQRDRIFDAYDTSKWPNFLKTEMGSPLLQHGFSVTEYDPSLKTEGYIWERMVRKTIQREYDGSYIELYKPIINPTASRFIHLDPSFRQDSTGMALVHIAGSKEVQRRDENGKTYIERAPIYVVDFILRINPPKGGEIEFAQVRDLVYQLSNHGYNIATVSMDKYVRDGLQPFQQKGYVTEWISVDETTEPYDVLKSAIYENRIYFYKYDRLIQELQLLEKRYEGKRIKIDHPAHFGKDLADAVAGAVFSASQHQNLTPLPFIKTNNINQGDIWMQEQLQSALGGNKNAGFNQELLGGGFISNWANEEGWSNLY